MFCPKCGTQNPDDGRFCRSCGSDLGNVSAALSGKMNRKHQSFYYDKKGRLKSKDPHDILGEGIRDTIVGIGFLVAAFLLFYTNIWGGQNWWWAMLFPGFGSLGKGVSNIVKYKAMTGKQGASTANIQDYSGQPQGLNQPQNNVLPPTQTDYVAPPKQSIYDTGELVERPGSVTEATTRHLQMDSEGDTMTLPKK